MSLYIAIILLIYGMTFAHMAIVVGFGLLLRRNLTVRRNEYYLKWYAFFSSYNLVTIYVSFWQLRMENALLNPVIILAQVSLLLYLPYRMLTPSTEHVKISNWFFIINSLISMWYTVQMLEHVIN